MDMALEFKNDFELLYPRFNATTIFQKLSEKYGIQTEKCHVGGWKYFQAIVDTIASLDATFHVLVPTADRQVLNL